MYVCEFSYFCCFCLSLSLSLNFGKRFWISFVSVCVESSEIFMNRIRFENVYAYTHMYNICVLCIVVLCIVVKL